MSTTAVPLQDLAQRIHQGQAELDRLRKEYEAKLRDLTRRREQLQSELRKVEAEIQGIGQAGNKAAAPKPAAAKPASKVGGKPGPRPEGFVSLPKLLVQIVGKAGKPVTVKELHTEVVRRKYPTTSANLAGMIDTRVNELIKRGLLARAKDQMGIVSASGGASKVSPGKSKATMNGSGPKAAPAKLPEAAGQPLPVVVQMVLAKSAHPLTARELADQVLATGYQTKSKDFINVLWSALGKMNNIENVQGKGYRLKK